MIGIMTIQNQHVFIEEQEQMRPTLNSLELVWHPYNMWWITNDANPYMLLDVHDNYYTECVHERYETQTDTWLMDFPHV